MNGMERTSEELLHDAVLVLRCCRRDEKAFRELVNRWEPRLYYYLRRIIEDEDAVWDVLQETWLAVFQSIRNLEDHRKFGTWLYQIARNKAVSVLRKENRHVQVTDEQIADYSEDNTDTLISKERAELIHQALNKLKIVHREVLTLHFIEGFSIKEVSQITGVSEGTTKSRLHYARNKLSEALKGMDNA
jgi:RNA polymerase sigma-70 factor (ECF subfamily)